MSDEASGQAAPEDHLKEAFFARLIESVNDLVFCLSPDARSLLYLNSAAQAAYGCELKELTSNPERWLEPIHPDDRQSMLQALNSANRNGDEEAEILFRLVQPDGNAQWLEGHFSVMRDDQGAGIAIVCIAKDVTKRVSTERALEEATAVYRSLVESLPINVFQKDLEGRLRFCNQRYCQLLGFPLEELIGKTDFDLFSHELATKYTGDDQQVIQSGNVFQDVEEHRKPDGQVTFVEVLKAPVRDVRGNIVGIQGMFWDVTARKRAEQALREAKELAEQASKAKSDFLANMSHEIRTPMNAILGMTELVLDTELESTQHDYLRMVHQSGEALLTVINDILDFSKIEAGKLKLDIGDFDLREELGNSLRALAVRAHDRGLELVFEVSADVPLQLRGDAGRLRQIVLNLVGNAIKFTNEGEVTLEITCLSRAANRCRLRFVVTDTGIGIPKEQLSKIFAEFEQVDASTTRNFGGTGLGLAIASHLVEMMGGKLSVESEVGQGSRFGFEIDFACLDNATAEGAPQSELKDIQILVVDDNQASLRVLQSLLVGWQARPVLARNAETGMRALVEAQQESRPISLIVADVNMPEVNGYEFARQVRADAALHRIPMVLLTSTSHPEEMELRRRLRIAAHLMKPVKPSELLRTLTEVLTKGEVKVAAQNSGGGTGRHLTNLRVLLVEDNVVNQRLAVGLLQKNSHHVTLAGNGKEAVQRYQQQEFDVILMDVQMPVMDGFQATAAIRELESKSGRKTPIIAMTARAMKGDRERCLEAGMDEYVSKPIRIPILMETLNIVLSSSPSQATADPQAIPATGESLIDWSIALESVNGDRSLLADLIEVFQVDSSRIFTEMDEAIKAQDSHSLRRLAHSMKGSLKYLGCGQAAELARDIEENGEFDDWKQVRTEVDLLRKNVDQLTTDLIAFKNSTKSG